MECELECLNLVYLIYSKTFLQFQKFFFHHIKKTDGFSGTGVEMSDVETTNINHNVPAPKAKAISPNSTGKPGSVRSVVPPLIPNLGNALPEAKSRTKTPSKLMRSFILWVSPRPPLMPIQYKSPY